MFGLPSLCQVCCKLRACKNARNLEETQNSSKEVSHLSIWFCEAKKQHSLPQGLNCIDFLYIDRPFLKTAVMVKGKPTGFRRMYFLHAESQRIKWLRMSHCRPAQNPSDLFRETKKRKKPHASKVWLKIFHYSYPLCSHHIADASSVLNSSHLIHLLQLLLCTYFAL